MLVVDLLSGSWLLFSWTTSVRKRTFCHLYGNRKGVTQYRRIPKSLGKMDLHHWTPLVLVYFILAHNVPQYHGWLLTNFLTNVNRWTISSSILQLKQQVICYCALIFVSSGTPSFSGNNAINKKSKDMSHNTAALEKRCSWEEVGQCIFNSRGIPSSLHAGWLAGWLVQLIDTSNKLMLGFIT